MRFRFRTYDLSRALFVGGTVLLVSLMSPAVRADIASSTSYLLTDGAIGLWGGEATSTSFSSVSGGQVVGGYSTSTNFALSSGGTDGSFGPKSQNWRWYDDETSLTPSDALANENTSPVNIIDGNMIKLRLTVQEANSIGGEAVKFRLQYATASDFTNASYVAEQGSCTGAWCYANGAGADNALIDEKVLSDSDACSGGTGAGCGTHNESGTSTSTLTFDSGLAKEFEFTLRGNITSPNTTYFFRAFDVNSGLAVPLNTGENNPSLVTGGTTLTFEVSGVPASTSTEGILTDVETTATTIPFGALSFGTSTKAAQRLTVSTNATQGYQLFVFQDQGLLNQSETEIPGVGATNASPDGWTSACASTSTGCYGYHAGDDALGGGSARFAPNDTYARLETDAREIGFSAIPVASDTVDIVYRTFVRVDQEYGSYSSNVAYIVVPVF